MCLAVVPILPFIPFLTGGFLTSPGAVSTAPQPPPQQGDPQGQQPQQNQQTEQSQQTGEDLNDIQNIEDFMSRFGRSYSSPGELAFRRGVFTQNLNLVNVRFKHSRFPYVP